MSGSIDHPQRILEEDVIEYTENRKPHISRDIVTAKSILQECSGDTGDCLYDHLSDIIRRVIDEKPSNVVDYFEQYSHQIKQEKFRMNENLLEDTYLEPEQLKKSQNLFHSLIKDPSSSDFPEALSDSEISNGEKKFDCSTDFMHLQFYWNFAGIGFPQDETYLLAISMKKLEKKDFISELRFWGHFYGLTKNYYVVEADLTLEGIAMKINEQETASHIHKIVDSFANLQTDSKITLQDMLLSSDRPETAPIPMTVQTEIHEIEPEKNGSGTNSQVYFVCNQIGDEWIELPPVTPQQIIISRQIKKYLTGNLNNEISSVPKFPGREKHYLRSLIARIASGTFVVPDNYYKFETGSSSKGKIEQAEAEDDESNEEEEEIEDVPKDLNKIRKNSSYNPASTKDLLNIQSWVHNRPFILNQGRTTADIPDEDIELKSVTGENLEEETESKSNSNVEEEIKVSSLESQLKSDVGIKLPSAIEIGPPLLSSCSNDHISENMPAWTTRLTSIGSKKDGMVLLRSNLWPGSFTIASEKTVSNIYIGWGHKFSFNNYSPPELPSMQSEFFSDPDLTELQDPTVEQEEELRMMKEMKRMELEDEHDFVDSEDDENENEEDKQEEIEES